MNGYRLMEKEEVRELFKIARAQSILDRGHIAHVLEVNGGKVYSLNTMAYATVGATAIGSFMSIVGTGCLTVGGAIMGGLQEQF